MVGMQSRTAIFSRFAPIVYATSKVIQGIDTTQHQFPLADILARIERAIELAPPVSPLIRTELPGIIPFGKSESKGSGRCTKEVIS